MKSKSDHTLNKILKNSPRAREVLAEFLKNIPNDTNEPKKIGSLVDKNTYENYFAAFEALLVILELFNVIESPNAKESILERKIKAKEKVAFYFIQSLADYIHNNLTLIKNWADTVENKEVSLANVFMWGNTVLRHMEQMRIESSDSPLPIRYVNVVNVLIKAPVEGYPLPLYLMQYDKESNQFQLIGNKKKKDESELNAIKRAIDNELANSAISYGIDYYLEKVGSSIKNKRISNSLSVYTEYTFTLFYMNLSKKLKLTYLDRWITHEEMRSGLAHEQLVVSPYSQFEHKGKILQKAFLELPNSTDIVYKQQDSSQLLNEIKKKSLQNKKNKAQTLLLEGETLKVEYKASLRWDYNNSKLNKALFKPVIKTICAFLNTEGGDLLVGVDDEGEVLGLKKDFDTLKRQDPDGYIQLLVNLVTSYIGVEITAYISVSIEKIKGKQVCIITVKPSPKPVFFKQGDNREFYIRSGNTSRNLNSEETYKYISMHW